MFAEWSSRQRRSGVASGICDRASAVLMGPWRFGCGKNILFNLIF